MSPHRRIVIAAQDKLEEIYFLETGRLPNGAGGEAAPANVSRAPGAPALSPGDV